MGLHGPVQEGSAVTKVVLHRREQKAVGQEAETWGMDKSNTIVWQIVLPR